MNYTKLRMASVCTVLLFSGTILQAKEWRGIVPLKSTRADVERLLGKPNKLGRYQFENERAYIHYAEGSCPANRNDCQCLVPNGTVLDIYVNLEVELKFSDLQVDRSKYKRITSGHLPTFVAYSNDDEGIVYTIDEEDDEVMDITYLPKAADCRNVVKSRKLNKRGHLTFKLNSAARANSSFNYDRAERFHERIPKKPDTPALRGEFKDPGAIGWGAYWNDVLKQKCFNGN